MKHLKRYGYGLIGGVVGFLTPYLFVGGLALMGSIGYREAVNSHLFLICVVCSTLLGIGLSNDGGDGEDNLRSN